MAPSSFERQLTTAFRKIMGIKNGQQDREKLGAGGKPSTWFPPGGLVEHLQVVKCMKILEKACKMSKNVEKPLKNKGKSKIGPKSRV